MTRHRYDYNEVMNLWAAGYSQEAICVKLRMARREAVSTIVQRARKARDPRALSRTTSRPKSWRRALTASAARRNIQLNVLVDLLLTAIAEGDLVDAVLDDVSAQEAAE